MKLYLILACLFSSALFGIVVPDDAEVVTGTVSSIHGTYLVESGTSAAFSGVNDIIYVESGASISLSSVGGKVYLETGATVTSNTSLNAEILRNQTFDEPQPEIPGVTTFRIGETVDSWVYFGPWPWVYLTTSSGDGWAFLDPSEEGLWVFPTFDYPILLLERQ